MRSWKENYEGRIKKEEELRNAECDKTNQEARKAGSRKPGSAFAMASSYAKASA
jgi:hypothetical protein